MAGNRNSGRKALPVNVHLLRGNPSKKSVAELQAAQVTSAPNVLPVALPS